MYTWLFITPPHVTNDYLLVVWHTVHCVVLLLSQAIPAVVVDEMASHVQMSNTSTQQVGGKTITTQRWVTVERDCPPHYLLQEFR